MIDAEAFLEHFGRKGMKWGVVNDDDAPSSSSGGTATAKGKSAGSGAEAIKREASARQYEAKATKLIVQKAAVEQQLAATSKYDLLSKRAYSDQIKALDKDIKTAQKDVVNAREGKMSERKRKLLIGAAVGGTILAAYGTRYAIQNGQVTGAMTRGRAAVNGNRGNYFKKNSKYSDPNASASDIMKNIIPGINPRYGDWGTNMNCRRATFTYEMRRRGYDVTATRTSNASGQTVLGVVNALAPSRLSIPERFKIAENKYVGGMAANPLTNNPYTLFRELSQQPERSRGEFAVMWKGPVEGIPGGGHSMAYEIIKGKAHIFDTQSGEEYDADHGIFQRVESAGFTRLDDKQLNETFLTKWMR